MEYNFNSIEVQLFYNIILSYLTFRLVVNIPIIKLSIYLPVIYFYYLLMAIFLGVFVFVDIYFNNNNKLNNLDLLFQRQLQYIINFTTILNTIDFIGIIMSYLYSIISHEYYDTEQNINNINYEKKDYEKKDNEKKDNEDEDEDEADEDEEDKEDKEDEEDKDNEENEDKDNEENEDDDSMPELISIESSSSDNDDNNTLEYKNNLSDECVEDIKKILSNIDSRQIRVLVRTINKYLNS